MRLLSPLRIKAIALLWGGLSASAIGDQLGTIAITWIAVDAFGTAAGYLTASQAAVALISALLIGRWSDGRNERWVMIGADLIRAAVVAGVVMEWEVTGRITALPLAGMFTILSIGAVAFRPAVRSIMPGLAPSPAMLPAVNSLMDGTERLARLLGPALIAMLAASIPVVHFLTFDAASFLISAAAVFLIGARPTLSVRRAAKGSLSDGFAAMRRLRLLGYLLHTSGINNGAWYAAMYLGVPLVLASGGAGSVSEFGTVIAAYGVSNLAGTLIVGSRPPVSRPARLIFCGNVVNGVGMGLMGCGALLPAAPLWALCAGAVIAGAGGPMNDVPRTTLMQTALPAADIAAAFRAWIVMASAGILVALVAAPTLFAWVGAGAGIVALGGLIACFGVWGLVLGLENPRVARQDSINDEICI